MTKPYGKTGFGKTPNTQTVKYFQQSSPIDQSNNEQTKNTNYKHSKGRDRWKAPTKTCDNELQV